MATHELPIGDRTLVLECDEPGIVDVSVDHAYGTDWFVEVRDPEHLREAVFDALSQIPPPPDDEIDSVIAWVEARAVDPRTWLP